MLDTENAIWISYISIQLPNRPYLGTAVQAVIISYPHVEKQYQGKAICTHVVNTYYALRVVHNVIKLNEITNFFSNFILLYYIIRKYSMEKKWKSFFIKTYYLFIKSITKILKIQKF